MNCLYFYMRFSLSSYDLDIHIGGGGGGGGGEEKKEVKYMYILHFI